MRGKAISERVENHGPIIVEAIGAALEGRVGNLFMPHGRMTKKQRSHLIGELDALPPDAPRELLSTGKLVG